jgi:ubiquinone biosynthesis protein UbiJ
MSATGYYPDLPPQPSPEEELRWLKEEADALARHQDQLSKRIQELEKRD